MCPQPPTRDQIHADGGFTTVAGTFVLPSRYRHAWTASNLTRGSATRQGRRGNGRLQGRNLGCGRCPAPPLSPPGIGRHRGGGRHQVARPGTGPAGRGPGRPGPQRRSRGGLRAVMVRGNRVGHNLHLIPTAPAVGIRKHVRVGLTDFGGGTSRSGSTGGHDRSSARPTRGEPPPAGPCPSRLLGGPLPKLIEFCDRLQGGHRRRVEGAQLLHDPRSRRQQAQLLSGGSGGPGRSVAGARSLEL